MTYITQITDGRDFIINSPVGNPTKAVIFNHGLQGNAASIAEQLGSPNPTNYYMVFSNGTPITDDPQKRKHSPNGDLASIKDEGYFAGIVEHLQELGVTDIYIAGTSNGAFMAAYLVANRPEWFTGALFASGYLYREITDIKAGNIKIRHIHGFKDNLVKMNGNLYDLQSHLKKFEEAGHTDIEAIVLNAAHEINDVVKNRILIELDRLVQDD